MDQRIMLRVVDRAEAIVVETFVVDDMPAAQFIGAHYDPARFLLMFSSITDDESGVRAVEPSATLSAVAAIVAPRPPAALSDVLCPRCQDHQLYADAALDARDRASGERVCVACGWFDDIAGAAA